MTSVLAVAGMTALFVLSVASSRSALPRPRREYFRSDLENLYERVLRHCRKRWL
jgi:hypothetical protein